MYTWKSYYVVQADYQHWANEVMFEALGHLKPEYIASDQGLFFRSIHHTVDHILLVSQVWQARLRGVEVVAPNYKVINEPDWRELENKLRKETRHLQDWLDHQPDAWFEGQIAYVSSDARLKSNWIRDALNHLFTHYAHHRGQISAVLTRLDAPCPEMDFIYYRRAMDRILAEN
jgi:uncharacterized damage-inducible protein DinB